MSQRRQQGGRSYRRDSRFRGLETVGKKSGKIRFASSFLYFQMPGATEVDESAFKVETLTLTQADAVRANFLAYNLRVKDSRTLLDRVLHEDPGF